MGPSSARGPLRRLSQHLLKLVGTRPPSNFGHRVDEIQVFRLPHVHRVVEERDEANRLSADGERAQVVPGCEHVLGYLVPRCAASRTEHADERTRLRGPRVKVDGPIAPGAADKFLRSLERDALLTEEVRHLFRDGFDGARAEREPDVRYTQARLAQPKDSVGKSVRRLQTQHEHPLEELDAVVETDVLHHLPLLR